MINVKEVEKINTNFLKQDKLSKDNFDFLSQIGAGSFGKVYKVKSKTNQNEYALKVLSKNQIKSLKLTDQLENEIRILSTCDHENITKLYGMFEDSNYVYLILELANKGTLLNKLRKTKTRKFNEKMTKHFMTDILKAIIYLHSKKPQILHRDIKPENILINDNTLKIADFGWSNVDDEIRNTFCGTPDYLSPEMILGTGHNEKLDIWTLGILMYELLHGEPPFSPKSNKIRDRRLLQKKIEDNILKGKISFDKNLSKEAKFAIMAMLDPDQKKRPNASEVMNLDFYKKKIFKKSNDKNNDKKINEKNSLDLENLKKENSRLALENEKQRMLIFNQKKNIELLNKLIKDKDTLIQKEQTQNKNLEVKMKLEKTNSINDKLKQDYKNAQKMINLMFHKSKEIIKIIDDFYNKYYPRIGESDKKNEISYEPSLKKLRKLFDDYSKLKSRGSVYPNYPNNGFDPNKLSTGSTYHTNNHRNAKSAQISPNRVNEDRPNSQNKITKRYLAKKQFTQKNLIKNEKNLKNYFNR